MRETEARLGLEAAGGDLSGNGGRGAEAFDAHAPAWPCTSCPEHLA